VGELADRDVDWDALAEAARGLSYADITRAADEAVKEAIIAEQRSVTDGVLIRALDERRTIQSRQRTAVQQKESTERCLSPCNRLRIARWLRMIGAHI